jgi:hypothetical protein
MTVFNRRYAVLGWTVWFLTKQIAKRKARRTLAADGNGGRRAIVPAALAATVATAVGALLFWRRVRGGHAGPAEGAQ